MCKVKVFLGSFFSSLNLSVSLSLLSLFTLPDFRCCMQLKVWYNTTPKSKPPLTKMTVLKEPRRNENDVECSMFTHSPFC